MVKLNLSDTDSVNEYVLKERELAITKLWASLLAKIVTPLRVKSGPDFVVKPPRVVSNDEGNFPVNIRCVKEVLHIAFGQVRWKKPPQVSEPDVPILPVTQDEASAVQPSNFLNK